MSIGFIPQGCADQIGSLFVSKYYSKLVGSGEKISSLYASNATINFDSKNFGVMEGIKAYIGAKLNLAYFDFSEASLICSPSVAYGVKVEIKGTVRREMATGLSTSELTQTFLLMPVRSGKLDVAYLILDDRLVLGKAKILPKKLEPVSKRKPERAAKSHKIKLGNQDPVKGSKEFSYAKAAATAPNEASANSSGSGIGTSQSNKKSKGYSQGETKHKIRVKKCPAGATAELLRAEFTAAFGAVAEVKKIGPTVAVVSFEDATTVDNIMSKPAKDRVLKLDFEEKVEVLDIWPERPHGFNRTRPKI